MHINILKLTFLSICLFLLHVLSAADAIAEVDSEESKTVHLLTTDSLDTLLDAVRNEKNGQRAVALAEQALESAIAAGSDLQIARAYHLSGVCWKNYGVPQKSLKRLKIAHNKYRELGMLHQKHIVIRDLGETYRAASQHAIANQYLNKSLRYFQSVGNVKQLAYTYDRIGAVYFELLYDHPDYPSLDSLSKWDPTAFQKNLSLFPELNQIYLTTILNIDSAVMLARQINLIPVMISSGILRAALDYLEQDVKKAIRNYDVVIGLIEESEHTRELPLALINQARIFGVGRLNQPEQAIAIAQKALNLATEFDIPVYAFLASEVLHDNYLAMDNYKMAYEMLNKMHELYERLEFDKMKLVVATQDYEYKLKEGEFEIRRRDILQRVVLLVSTIVVLFLSSLLLVIYRSKYRKNAMLKELKQKNDLVVLKNEELQMVNAQKDRLIAIIAHDLRNPFNTILGFSEMIQEEFHAREPAEIKRFAGMIRSSAIQTLQLLASLQEWSRFQEGRISFQIDQINLKNIVNEALQILFMEARQKEINVHVKVDERLTISADRHMMIMALRNLINNAIKYTPRGGDVWIHAAVENQFLKISIQDTGVGMDETTLNNIFKVDVVINTPGTENERGSGFGLVLCEQFIRKHGGKIWAESAVGKGSTFFFTLPIDGLLTNG